MQPYASQETSVESSSNPAASKMVVVRGKEVSGPGFAARWPRACLHRGHTPLYTRIRATERAANDATAMRSLPARLPSCAGAGPFALRHTDSEFGKYMSF
jgi:hypothetical protein